MKLRIKVKHLAAVLLGMIVLAGCFIWAAPRMELALAEKQASQHLDAGKAKLREVIDQSAGTQKYWQHIQEYMIPEFELFGQSLYDVMIGASTEWNGEANGQQPFSLVEASPYLKRYVEAGPLDKYYIRAAEALYYADAQSGQGSQTLQALDTALTRVQKRKLSDLEAGVQLLRARWYMDHRQPELAEPILQVLKADGLPQDLGWYAKGRWTRLQEELTRHVRSQLAGTVEGTVKRSDGTPLTGASVYLRLQQDMNHSLRDEEPYKAMTDDEGRYRFEGVAPGSYQLFLGLTYSQIDGWVWPDKGEKWIEIKGKEHVEQTIVLQRLMELKSPANEQVITGDHVKFEWEPVEGAAYYKLLTGMKVDSGWIAASFLTHIQDHQISVSLEDLYDQTTGIAYSNEDNLPDPVTMLGFANSEGEFLWNVEAYDSRDQLITRSNGYRLNESTMGNLPLFQLKARTLTPADQLVKQKKYPEALQAYLQVLKTQPKDLHSLRMVVRILEANQDQDKTARDRALPYMKRLAAVKPSTSNLWRLVSYYYDQENWKEFNNYYAKMREVAGSSPDSYDLSIYATALMKQGKLKEAEVQFKKALDMDIDHRFIGAYLALLLADGRGFAKALEAAEHYTDHDMSIDKMADWPSYIRSMQSEAEASPSSAAYEAQLQEKLAWYMHGEEDQLQNWLKRADQPALSIFIKALLKVR
ncbi:carboxypeptidase-like regulatory domain-containing protein [Paenibacillus sp. CAA11]|uniref:carboxypeptidase-like regulatory domain-containing protein n=1 Tax=Paenibacillus sp. CAA11 TaxID=1532905 RepID=UPI00131EF95B|nr:carboxypeptidase-like regulatory domain-containing protein [Paenibacillus sp. CAA11]